MEQLAAAYSKKYPEKLDKQVASGKMMFKHFLGNSILVRDFTGHPVLTGCIRLTVGTPEENKVIMEKLSALCLEVSL